MNKKVKLPSSKKSILALLLVQSLYFTALISEAGAENSYAEDDLLYEIEKGDKSKLSALFNNLPTSDLIGQLLPENNDWVQPLLKNLSTKISIPYASIFDFLKEQEKFEGLFSIYEQFPAPVITIATPTQGSSADFVAVSSASSWANQTLFMSEISIEYLASHLGASYGLGTTGGLGMSAGVGGTAGLGATTGAGLATGIGTTAGLSSSAGVNVGTGSSISVGAGASLGLPVTLNDIVTNAFHKLRSGFWRVNTQSGDSLKLISPILVTVGNPEKNPQTARLNDGLPLYFEQLENDESWSIIHRRKNKVYDGHVGIISLSTRLPLPDVNFQDGALGADMITLMVASTDDEGMKAVARILEKNETDKHSLERDLIRSYMRGLIIQGLSMTKPLERLRHFTRESREAWGKADTPFTFLAQNSFTDHVASIRARAQDSKVSKILHNIAENGPVTKQIHNAWTSREAMRPGIFSGQALLNAGNSQAGNTSLPLLKSSQMDADLFASYPLGLSLLVFADDDGEPVSVKIVAH